jgi:D-threonate/D-erythronate kinase
VVLDLDERFFHAPLDAFAAPWLERMRAGHDILLHTSASHEAYDRVRRMAAERGMPDAELAARVERLLQHLVAPFLARCKAFVFSGGNTAQSVYRLLDARGLSIFGHEVLPGTPVAKVRGGPYDGRLFLTKPGSFGTADDLAIMLNFAKYAPEPGAR